MRTGPIWIGSRRGVSKFDPSEQNFHHITSRVMSNKGLNDQNVWAITEAPKGILWVGTRKGITRVDRKKKAFYHYDREIQDRKGVNDKSVLSLCVREQVWVGCVDGLYRLELSKDASKGRFQKMEYKGKDTAGALERSKVYSITPSQDGGLWLGTRTGLKHYDIESGKVRIFDESSGTTAKLSHSLIRDVHSGKNGDLWTATDGGGLNRLSIERKNGDRSYEVKVYQRDPDDPNSLNTNSLMSIWEGKNGYLWLGTYGGGLNRFDPETGQVVQYTEKEGLPNNVVYGVLGDRKGNLWMSTNRGLCRFDIDRESFTVYEESDGLQSNEFNIGAYHRSSSGEMFFGGINGLNAFYPSEIRKNPFPPELIFTELRLFNLSDEAGKKGKVDEHIRSDERIVLAPDQNNFTLEFAALHYSQPRKNRYRYFLEGFDKDTVEAGRDRTAHYTNLDPGSYKFKVWSCNSDGVWTQEPKSVTIRVERPFWATWWFRGSALLVLACSVFGVYRYRVNLIERQKRKLELEVRRRIHEVTQQKERIEEQNKLLEAEKEKVEEQRSLLEEEKNKVDKLLVNILPEDTANELKTGGRASARHYRMASVMFTDFKGFTKIAENMKATELVAKLDSYFIKFDQIIEKWELEKIKTIGDAYMSAGGIPIRNKTNPIHTVLAGMEIQRYMQEQRERLEEKEEAPWELRIGIHTGELIAGVIGIKRYAYDIWGDTVNVAARMESNSEIGKVNISGATYSYIEPFFECTYRGKVHAKNKGHIDMYFVDRIKPELSVDGKGKEPNQAFWEYMNLHFFSKINYRKAEKALLKKLRKELPENLYYHDVRHTVDVCQAVERLAFMEGIEGEDLFLLKTAALFHDAGFVERYEKNEWIGARMAKDMLPNYGYTEDQLDKVASMIHATQVPPRPQDHLEEIICDADLDYLGREDFHEIADKLRKELMERGYIGSMIEWDRLQVSFLRQHQYFTDSAINLRRKKKLEHLREIEERLEKMEGEAQDQGPGEG
ncbi:MAG: adenylate/guanylate cyclase domain-containing protein [Flavobacteriales bacterium]